MPEKLFNDGNSVVGRAGVDDCVAINIGKKRLQGFGKHGFLIAHDHGKTNAFGHHQFNSISSVRNLTALAQTAGAFVARRNSHQ